MLGLRAKDFDLKLSQLTAIEQMSEKNAAYDKPLRDCLWVCLTFVSGQVAFMVALDAFQVSPHRYECVTAITILVMALAFFGFNLIFPKSDPVALDRLIADYDPVDERAYDQFQNFTRKASGFNPLELSCWTASERAAICERMPITHGRGT